MSELTCVVNWYSKEIDGNVQLVQGGGGANKVLKGFRHASVELIWWIVSYIRFLDSSSGSNEHTLVLENNSPEW